VCIRRNETYEPLDKVLCDFSHKMYGLLEQSQVHLSSLEKKDPVRITT
jgi:hypothetical protein